MIGGERQCHQALKMGIKVHDACCPAMEDVETRFKFALLYINKGGLAAQHPGQPAPSHEVLLEYYA